MASSVRIRIEDFEDGLLPGICASSGADGARLYATSLRSKPIPWLLLAIFAGPFGILAAIVLASALRKTVEGYVPYTPKVHAQVQRRVIRCAWGVAQGFGAVVAALVLAVAGPDSFAPIAVIVGIAGLLAFAVFSFLCSNPPGSVGGHLDSTGRWVVLDPVATRFALAYEAQEDDRREARRAEVIGTRLGR